MLRNQTISKGKSRMGRHFIICDKYDTRVVPAGLAGKRFS